MPQPCINSDAFLNKLLKMEFDKNMLKELHGDILSNYSNYCGTQCDDTGLIQNGNIVKMQLKVVSVLLEYVNNLNGNEPVSIDHINWKLSNDKGEFEGCDEIESEQVKKNEAQKQLYACPNCNHDVTKEVNDKIRKRADLQYYYCGNCDQLFQEANADGINKDK